MSISKIDKNKVPEVLKIINELSKKKILIGILGASGSDIVMIANVNEFGANITITPKMRTFFRANRIYLNKSTTTLKIPERSYIRASYDSNINKINNYVDKQLTQVLSLSIPVNVFLDRVGNYCVSIIKSFMTDLSTPPKSQVTLKLSGKNKTNPLIDTGRLRNSITYKVV